MLRLERILPAAIAGRFAVLRRVLIVNGHPDPRPERFCAALCDAYQAGAQSGGWDARRLDVGTLGFGADRFLCEEEVESAIQKIRGADQLVIVFPLWLNQPPAILRSLLGRMAAENAAGGVSERPARTIITMEMPAFAHRALAMDSDASGLTQSLALPGLSRQERAFIGGIGAISFAQRIGWLARMHQQGIEGLQ